jgi:hypothetical protein
MKYSGAWVHERPCSRTIRFTNKFSEQKTSRMSTLSRITNTQAGNSGSVSCWLTNLISVYEHFSSLTAPKNELSS